MNYKDSIIEMVGTMENEEYLKKIVLEDEYGPVNFYFLPFFKLLE